MNRSSFLRPAAAMAAVIFCFATLVAAGSARPVGHSSSTADTLIYKLRVTPGQAAAARAAGAKAAAAAGKPVALPTGKKIGMILLSAQSTTSVRIVAAAKEIGKLLGYSVAVCDSNFNAQKVQQCATALVAQHVNLVLTVTIDPAQEGGALVTAKQAGIPWLGLGTYESPNPNVLSYYGDVRAEGQVYNDWLFNRMLAKVGSGATAQLASYDATSVGAGSRIAKASRLATLKTYPRIKEVVDHDLDIANIVQDTLDTTGQTIGQYPELTAFWTVCDLCVPLIAQELDTKGITGAARPLVSGEFSTPQTVVDIRKGTVTGVMDEQWEASAWVAVDQALELWARGKAIPANGTKVYGSGYALKFMQPYILSKANISTGPAPSYGSDYLDFFKSKWHAEFGTKG